MFFSSSQLQKNCAIRRKQKLQRLKNCKEMIEVEVATTQKPLFYLWLNFGPREANNNDHHQIQKSIFDFSRWIFFSKYRVKIVLKRKKNYAKLLNSLYFWYGKRCQIIIVTAGSSDRCVRKMIAGTVDAVELE